MPPKKRTTTRRQVVNDWPRVDRLRWVRESIFEKFGIVAAFPCTDLMPTPGPVGLGRSSYGQIPAPLHFGRPQLGEVRSRCKENRPLAWRLVSPDICPYLACRRRSRLLCIICWSGSSAPPMVRRWPDCGPPSTAWSSWSATSRGSPAGWCANSTTPASSRRWPRTPTASPACAAFPFFPQPSRRSHRQRQRARPASLLLSPWQT